MWSQSSLALEHHKLTFLLNLSETEMANEEEMFYDVCSHAPTILSIQSHVVHGYVGNKIASFFLQLNGFHVDLINTVHYISSINHKGPTLSIHDAHSLLIPILQSPNKYNYNYFLTGYIGEPCFLLETASFLKHHKKSSIWLCDPVLGDDNILYVEEGIIQVYIEHALPYIDIITPNHYELQWLTNKISPLTTLEDTLLSCSLLHKKGISLVVISSVAIGHEELFMVVSYRSNGRLKFAEDCEFVRSIPRVPYSFYGCGDLFSCALLSAYHYCDSVEDMCDNALAIVQDVIKDTIRRVPSEAKLMELDIVNARGLLYTRKTGG